MTVPKKIRCVKCGRSFPINLQIFECDSCQSALDIVYDYDIVKSHILKEDFRREPVSHWKYWMFYPVDNLSKRVTMGEGGTPLLESKHNKNMFYKTEFVNPTCSFKDRGSSIEITKALELGVKEVACASTGNMGASVASYSARAGIKCTIYLPPIAADSKIAQIKAAGAGIVNVKGTYDDAVKATLKLREQKHIYLTGDYAYRGEGTKSVGFEIIDQLGWQVPDYLVMPVGNAVLFSSVYKAMRELKEVGMIQKLPKLVAVQAKGCSPIVESFNNHRGHGKEMTIVPVKNPKTIASAIACGNPVDGLQALEALDKTHGLAVAVTDKELIDARKALGNEGVWVEPSGAAAAAGIEKLGLKGTIVAVLTGHGLKGPY